MLSSCFQTTNALPVASTTACAPPAPAPEITFKSVHVFPVVDDELEEDDFCKLLDIEEIVVVLDIALLETALEMLDSDKELLEADDVFWLLELAELCGLDELEPDPPQAVK